MFLSPLLLKVWLKRLFGLRFEIKSILGVSLDLVFHHSWILENIIKLTDSIIQNLEIRKSKVPFSSVQLLRCVWLFVIPWMLGFHVHHQLPEPVQSHASQIGDANSSHPVISSSLIPFFSCLQCFPASVSFPMSQFFTSGSQSIGASHHLSSPSLPAFNLSQHQGLFQWVSSLHWVAKVLELQYQSFQWIFRTDFL